MDQTRIYTADRHRFFDDLFNMLVAYVSFGVAINVSRGENPSLDAAQSIKLLGSPQISGTDLRIHPSEILAPVLGDRRPDRIELEQSLHIDWGQPRRREPRIVVTPMIHAAFVHYYESVLEQIEAGHGHSRSWHSWPEVLRFGRAVRNAFTHGGRVYFTDPKAPAATWRGLTYGPADNGREVLYHDLMAADVILLMEEIDAAF